MKITIEQTKNRTEKDNGIAESLSPNLMSDRENLLSYLDFSSSSILSS